MIFSGGQDSTTLAGWAQKTFDEVVLLSFDYGQRHRVELEQGSIIAKKLGLRLVVVRVDCLKEVADSALFASSEENLASAHSGNEALPASFVPNRNALFLTLAHSFAQKIGAEHLAIGVSQEDNSGYPDCSLEFVQAMQKALNIGAGREVQIHTPLIHMDKAREFELAKELGVLEIVLEDSHTCYEGVREVAHAWGYGCGECKACVLRKRAYEKFEQNLQRGVK